VPGKEVLDKWTIDRMSQNLNLMEAREVQRQVPGTASLTASVGTAGVTDKQYLHRRPRLLPNLHFGGR
jgi:hypothetical protein